MPLYFFPVWTSQINQLEAQKEQQEILFGLRQASQEVKFQQQGTLEEKTLDGFLEELKIIFPPNTLYFKVCRRHYEKRREAPPLWPNLLVS
jgi:hypothetical protein